MLRLITIRAYGAPPPWPISSGFAPDSPLEQTGFEPSVPARTAVACPPISLDSSSTKTLVDANDRRSGPYDGEVSRVARGPGAPSSPQTGTEGSQPLLPLPGTLGFSVVFLWQHDYWNQFSFKFSQKHYLPN
jgi:hypothetical protein